MKVLPLFCRLENRDCLVASSNETGIAKARSLANAGARVIYATNLDAVSEEKANEAGVFRLISLEDGLGAIPDRGLVILSGLDVDTMLIFRQEASRRGCWVNVVDQPDHSDVVFGAVIDRAPVKIGVFSGGNAPAVSRSLREQIEAILPENLGDVVRKATPVRTYLKNTKMPFEARARLWSRFWTQFVQGRPSPLPDTGDSAAISRFVKDLESPIIGTLSLIEVPKDVDLITLRDIRKLSGAEEIIGSKECVEAYRHFCRRDARFYSGENANLPSLATNLENGTQAVWLWSEQHEPPFSFLEDLRQRRINVEGTIPIA